MSLRIDLLRHGLALPAGPSGDATRALAPEGVASLRALAALLARAGWRPDHAFTSPLARARETATIVLREAGVAIEAAVLGELEPEREPANVSIALSAEIGAARRVLVVGHQPLLGRLAGYWTRTPVPLAPGELLGVEFDARPVSGAGRIVERISPP